jgi:PAS domain S-box-containing protein
MTMPSTQETPVVDDVRRYPFHALPDPVLVADAESRYVDANAAALKLLGYTLAELQTMTVADIVAHGKEWTTCEFERFRATGSWEGRVVVRSRSRTLTVVEARATAVRLPDRTAYLSVLRELRTPVVPTPSRTKARILVVDDEPANRKLLADLVVREGYEALVATGGAEALALLTHEPVDLVLLDLMMPGIDGMAVLTALQAQQRLPALPVVVVTAHDDRKVRIDALTAGAVDFVGKPLDRFEVACRIRTLVDLKRLRDASAADAAGVRAQLQAVLASAPDFVVSLDRDGVIRYMNRATPPYSVEQLVGSTWVSLGTTPEARAASAATLDRVLTTGESARFASSSANADGSTIYFESHIGAVRLAGEIVGAVVVARDVTHQKRTEMQLTVSDRMASVGTLAAGVAHEINNPLAAVMANLDLALDGTEALAQPLDPDKLAELREELRDAHDAADRIRQIVRDLKLFSRAEDVDVVVPVDVQRVLESTLRMARNEIRHRTRVVKDYGKTPLVLANESRLGQVFLNLVVNAAQAIREGNAEHNEIRIGTSMDSVGRVQVDIRDTGPGIPPDVLGRLFTPFFTTKPVGLGTGLGLSICHRIVTELGGEIQVESAPGEGTMFRVLLRPVPRDHIDQSDAVAVPQRVAARRGRIMVIDDEPVIGQTVRRVLAKDHDVTVVERAQEALDLLLGAENHFDVIFCDLMMPQMTGMDLYEQLTCSEFPEQATRIVFLTGGAFSQQARHFLDEVTNPRLEKPFDAMHLRTLVNERIR